MLTQINELAKSNQIIKKEKEKEKNREKKKKTKEVTNK